MNNKPIPQIQASDFIGYWKNMEGKEGETSLYVSGNLDSTLKINSAKYTGKLVISYGDYSTICNNCLQLNIRGKIFHIKQVDNNGFYLTTDSSEVYLFKVSQTVVAKSYISS